MITPRVSIVGCVSGCVLLAALSLLAGVAYGQKLNTIFADQFPGNTVGEKVAAAQHACIPDTAIPCYIAIEAPLVKFSEGVMPVKCTQCTWEDFRVGGEYVKSSGPGGTIPITELPPQLANLGHCSTGQYPKFENTDGTWSCGTLPTVSAGAGYLWSGAGLPTAYVAAPVPMQTSFAYGGGSDSVVSVGPVTAGDLLIFTLADSGTDGSNPAPVNGTVTDTLGTPFLAVMPNRGVYAGVATQSGADTVIIRNASVVTTANEFLILSEFSGIAGGVDAYGYSMSNIGSGGCAATTLNTTQAGDLIYFVDTLNETSLTPYMGLAGGNFLLQKFDGIHNQTLVGWTQAGAAGPVSFGSTGCLNPTIPRWKTNYLPVIAFKGITTAIGADRDFYFDSSASMLYGPKLNGSWGVGLPLRGAASIGGNGYQFNGGTLQEWQVISSLPDNSATTAAFPLAFPHAVFGITCTSIGNAGNPRTIAATDVDVSTFSLIASGSGASAFCMSVGN